MIFVLQYAMNGLREVLNEDLNIRIINGNWPVILHFIAISAALLLNWAVSVYFLHWLYVIKPVISLEYQN